MNNAKFGDPDRQIPVAPKPLIEDLDMPWAIHRLNRVVPVIDMRCKHIVPKLVPMT